MRRTPLLIFLVWVVVCFGYNYWQIAIHLAGPESNDDLYARTWRYQWFVFCVFLLPAWIAGLLFALSAEGFWYRRRHPQPNKALQVTARGGGASSEFGV